MNFWPVERAFEAILSLNKSTCGQVMVYFWIRILILWQIFTIINSKRIKNRNIVNFSHQMNFWPVQWAFEAILCLIKGYVWTKSNAVFADNFDKFFILKFFFSTKCIMWIFTFKLYFFWIFCKMRLWLVLGFS